MAFKKAKIKPVRVSRPARGVAGKFKAKASIHGTAKIKQFFDVLKGSTLEVVRRELRGVAEAAREEVVERIEGQKMPGMGGSKFGRPRTFKTPLHPFTLSEKARLSQDPRILIATGFYANHIDVVEEKFGKGYSYRVGFSEKMHPSGIPLEKLARIQEYGAKIEVTPKMRAYLHWRGLHLKEETKYITIPPRPHFMPVFLRVRREVKRITKWRSQNLSRELKKRLRKARIF